MPRTLVSTHARRHRGVLAAGAVGALVVVPAGAAVADDAEPEPGAEPAAAQPEAPALDLPTADPEDRVAPDEATEEPGEPVAAPEEELDGAAPALPADPALAAAADEPAAEDVAMAPYFGTGKVSPAVVADESPLPDLSGAVLTVTGEPAEGEPWTEMFTTGPLGLLTSSITQAAHETITITLTTPPPGFMVVDPAPVVVPPCVVEVESPPEIELPSCFQNPELEVVRAYRTVQIKAVTAAGAPVPGVTAELHSPLEAASSVGGGTAAAVVPGRSLLGSMVTDPAGLGTLATRVPPASGYLVVPTQVPDGWYLPPSFALDLAAVPTVAEADTPVVLTLTMVPALAATGSTSGALVPLAAGLLAAGAGSLALRRRLVRA